MGRNDENGKRESHWMRSFCQVVLERKMRNLAFLPFMLSLFFPFQQYMNEIVNVGGDNRRLDTIYTTSISLPTEQNTQTTRTVEDLATTYGITHEQSFKTRSGEEKKLKVKVFEPSLISSPLIFHS
jgi:hypothetical protein